MTDESALREKLRKIETLLVRAGTAGERAAAGAAAERIRARLRESVGSEPSVELRFSIADPWSRRLFIALARRYGLRPYRHARMRRQTVIIRAPRSFLETVLWPTFVQINGALVDYLSEVTEKVIREEVHRDATDAESSHARRTGTGGERGGA